MGQHVSNSIEPFNVADANVRVTAIHGHPNFMTGERTIYLLTEMSVEDPSLTYVAISKLGGFGRPSVVLEVVYQSRFTTDPNQDGFDLYDEGPTAHGLLFVTDNVDAYISREILEDVEAFLDRVS